MCSYYFKTRQKFYGEVLNQKGLSMGIGQETPFVEWISSDGLGYVAVTNDPQLTVT